LADRPAREIEPASQGVALAAQLVDQPLLHSAPTAWPNFWPAAMVCRVTNGVFIRNFCPTGIGISALNCSSSFMVTINSRAGVGRRRLGQRPRQQRRYYGHKGDDAQSDLVMRILVMEKMGMRIPFPKCMRPRL
jgi:hypothetical protein